MKNFLNISHQMCPGLPPPALQKRSESLSAVQLVRYKIHTPTLIYMIYLCIIFSVLFCYAHMQVLRFVSDHLVGCICRNR